MDLEVLKKEWQENESFKKEVEDNIIKNMIVNRNKGAFERIKRYEKQALRIIPVCIIAFIMLSMRIILHGGGFGIFWVLLMIPAGALLWYWSYYLCNFLDKIDMAGMSVTEVTEKILKYKTYLIRHTVAAAILMPAYMGVWLYQYVSSSHPGFAETITGEFYVYYLAAMLICFFAVIWFRYFKHIRNIQNNLKELEEFKKG